MGSRRTEELGQASGWSNPGPSGPSRGPWPNKGQQSPGLRLAGLEGNPRPPELAAQANVLPIMSAFVHKKGFPFGNRMNLDAMRFQVIGKRLLDDSIFR